MDDTPARAAAPPEPAPTAYRVLARKYRPTRFAELIGQEAMVRTLSNAFARARLAHAFLLAGVRGVGKTTTARIIARALNCTGPDGGQRAPVVEPCGLCPDCRAIADDRHIDVLEMDAASRTGVDDIRELLDGVRYLPTVGRFKVYILDEIHMLSEKAFNALLKTLEEPPAHVKFVFATTEPRRVPITVLSRCQRFDLRRVDAEALYAHLGRIAAAEGARASEGALRLIARAADGSVRDGLSLLDQAIGQAGGGAVEEEAVREMLGLADRIEVFDLFEAVLGGDVAGALDRLDRQYRFGADPAVVLQDLLELTHWLTTVKIVPQAAADPGLPEAERVRGRALAERLAMPDLTRTWQVLLKGLKEAQAAPAPLQAAEMVLVRLAYLADLPSPAELVRRIEEPRERAGAPKPPAPAAGGGQPRAALAADPQPAPRRAPETRPAPAPEGPKSFAEAVELFARDREMVLYAHLLDDVHLVRFEPGHIELRLRPQAPPRLAAELAERLNRWTGRRWLVAVSDQPGAPTLAEQAAAADAARKARAAEEPLVRAILAAFPDAEITAVVDPARGEAIPDRGGAE